LIFGSDGKDLDEVVSHVVLAKMVVTYVNMFGVWAQLWEPCKFQCTRVVFENFAIHVVFSIDDWEPFPPYFLNENHDRRTSRRDWDIEIYLASMVESATWVCNFDAQIIEYNSTAV
jgi:hypothetical protein